MSTATRTLKPSELFILQWLAKEDSSAYGECKGKDLDALVALELVVVNRDPPNDYSRVSVTDLGFSLLIKLQEAKP